MRTAVVKRVVAGALGLVSALWLSVATGQAPPALPPINPANARADFAIDAEFAIHRSRCGQCQFAGQLIDRNDVIEAEQGDDEAGGCHDADDGDEGDEAGADAECEGTLRRGGMTSHAPPHRKCGRILDFRDRVASAC